ncbi:MAG: PQQ-binding-like beta-propeller repeat protein [Pirellulales bacterium]
MVWRKPLSGRSLAGLAATEQYLLVADRDPLDSQDIFRCLRTSDGEEVWTLRYGARGNLDYGNAPRATPLIAGDLAYLYGAFGVLHCVKLATGETVWKKDLLREFGGRDAANHWGAAASPLVADGKLICNPGGPAASVVALDPKTGDVVWKTPGERAAFASFIVGELGGRRQLVGYEKTALCGYDLATGARLWRLVPKRPNDFNVPTPLVVLGKLLVTTENNGTRLYEFDREGRIVATPVATNDDLAPDTHTPVALGARVFGVWAGLHCLDAQRGLETVWSSQDPAYDDYAVILAAGDRLLVVSKFGELLLVDAAADQYRLVSRLAVFMNDPGVYAHPAILGTRLFLRGSEEVLCLELAPQAR